MAPTLFQKLFSKRSGLGAPGRDARDPDCAFREVNVSCHGHLTFVFPLKKRKCR